MVEGNIEFLKPFLFVSIWFGKDRFSFDLFVPFSSDLKQQSPFLTPNLSLLKILIFLFILLLFVNLRTKGAKISAKPYNHLTNVCYD